MKLYYSPGSCALTAHILLAELGLTYKIEKVNLAERKTETGEDYLKINPKGYVPALEITNGEILTEGPAIAQYLADLKPQNNLLPPFGKIERYHVLSWLNFVATELHKNFSPLFNKTTTPEHKQFSKQLLEKRLQELSTALQDKPYLHGQNLTIADVYLYNVLRWTKYVEISLDPWPNLQKFMQNIADRPSVQRALKEQGIH